MDVKTAAALRRMRIISVAEAVSFLVLLIFGSLLSRISSVNLVMPLGMLHGVLFVLYVVFLADVWSKAGWSRGRAGLFLLLAVLPAGGFFGDRRIRDEQAAAGDPAVAEAVGA